MRTQLQELRKLAGFKSARAFAEHMGISPSTYTHYEQGDVSMPIEVACDFCKELECTLDQLAGLEPIGGGLTAQELKILRIYREADDRGKQIIDAVIETQKTTNDLKSPLAPRRAVV